MIFSKRKQLPYQKTYSFRGRKMSYRQLGQGKPVVLLHGSMMADPWDGFEKLLAKKYRVYLPEMPGFGASDAIPGARHNTDLFAEAFAVFVKKKKLEKVPVVALSLGTITAAKAAEAQAVKGKLILVGAPSKIFGLRARFLQAFPLFLKRLVISADWVKKRVLGPVLRENIGGAKKRQAAEFLRQVKFTDPRAIVDVNYRREVEVDFPAALGRLKNDKVFLYGERDRQKKFASFLTEKWIEIPDSGHDIFRTNPEATFKCLTEVL